EGRSATDQLKSLRADGKRPVLMRAETSGDAAIPAYTHLQRAEPVLVAHWLLASVEMFLRDSDRLADCRRRLNVCPLGSGAVAGATLALGGPPMAHPPGFYSPTCTSLDARQHRG